MLEALFLAAAKAAPAATAAGNSGDGWRWLVPVATLVLGFGLKWFQDYITERRRRKHERALRREQRFDQLRMRRMDAERTNLIMLQPLCVALLRAGRQLRNARDQGDQRNVDWCNVEVAPELRREPGRLVAELLPIRTRLHTVKVIGQFDEFIQAFWDALHAVSASEASSRWIEVESTYKFLIEATGNAIRDLEDENQQLGDPPTQ